MSNLTLVRRGLLAVLGVVVLAAAGCGDGDDDGGGGAASSGSEPRGEATVAVASSSLGDVLVDSEGRTLYLFTKDEGDTSACTGGCASAWPAVTIEGEPVAGDGVDESKLGTNADGQVTYAGKLLYRYAQDQAAGDVRGQGVGGVWFVVDAGGKAVQESSSADDAEPTPSY